MKTQFSIAAACAILIPGTVVLAANSGEAADVGAPVVLRGPVPAGASGVTASLLPRLEDLSAGQRADIVPLTDAEVEVSDGRFAIAVEPSAIPPQFIGTGGIVDFEVNAQMPDGTVQSTESSSRITKYQGSAQLFWSDPSETLTKVQPAPAARGVRSLAGVVNARTEVEDDGSFIEDQYVPRQGGGTCYTEDTSQRRFVSTTIGTAYPFGESTGSMAVSSSQGANYGIGASSDNSAFSLNGSKFTQDGWSYTWTADTRGRSFRKDIEYGKYKTTCAASGGAGQGPYYYYEWKWRPLSETGGVDSNFDVARPNWTRCANVGPGTWSRDSSSGSAYSYGGAVKFASVIGIDLSITRQYSAAQKLVYQVAGNNKALCGSNAMPANAGKIMMTRR